MNDLVAHGPHAGACGLLASKSGCRFVGGPAGLSLGWLSLCAGEFSIAMRWNVICMQDVFVVYRNFLTEKHAFLYVYRFKSANIHVYT